MRIYRLLTESVSLDIIADYISRDCKPFLKQVATYTPPMLRGQGAGLIDIIPGLSISSTKPNRHPLDTSIETHQIADQWFEQKFGIRFRSAHVVFVTSDDDTAFEYGGVGMVIPIGDFSFCWSSKYADVFYTKLNERHIKFQIDAQSNKRGITKEQVIIDTLENANYQDSNLIAAIFSQNEIMIHCQKYYFLDLMSESEYKHLITLAKEKL